MSGAGSGVGQDVADARREGTAGQLLEKIQTHNERREENEKIYMEGVVQPDALPSVGANHGKIVVPVELMGGQVSRDSS